MSGNVTYEQETATAVSLNGQKEYSAFMHRCAGAGAGEAQLVILAAARRQHPAWPAWPLCTPGYK